ncbi:hypothetical protein SAMN05421595_0016 [Austwickia chelonae]|uniref:NodB homology domain-containing protein n=1 Tax=Austwickia chelonae NBRC 105200 TaxID=1184607 RepID=K6VTY3_9MICO|nr:hypothetical protein [Austwickia chelonae]GAB78805.1 hypothetical protein AUCHE_17_00150 [Austwickia chelonae NBRC 105200]SEV84557.1 hypothetical protein SAMN05421595_0016 [Austwickia chelonae]
MSSSSAPFSASRRTVLQWGGLGAAIAAASAISGCAGSSEPSPGSSPGGSGAPSGGGSSDGSTGSVKPIGDGSTSQTGPQPHQPKAERWAPGQPPPQFVVISWDGAAELPSGLLTRFRKVSQEVGGAMTLFLTGIYVIPEAKAKEYAPPRRRPGASDISFLTERSVRRTIIGIGEAWKEGHEIGTHFNGHFCGPKGVAAFSEADWEQEIDEAYRLVQNWRTITGYRDLPSLPFDYRTELIGGRTPCLEGREKLLPVAKRRGWRYDSSGTRSQKWPTRDRYGLWDISMGGVPFKGGREVIAMDYNFMYQFAKDNVNAGSAAERQEWKKIVIEALLAGFDRAYRGHRAPLIIGNHFEQWNGGIYMDAVETAMREMARHPEVRFVSFRQLVDWMEVQDPGVLSALQALPVGRAPEGGWGALKGQNGIR